MFLSSSWERLGWASRAAVLGAVVLAGLYALPAYSFDGSVAQCSSSEDCSDGLFCNGYENCENGSCVDSVSPCDAGESCDEEADLCVGTSPNPGLSTELNPADVLECANEAADVD